MKMLEKDLSNQIAIVTGGTAGIGKTIAIKLAEQGAKVFIFGTNPERGKQVVDEIGALTGNSDRAAFYSVDVSQTQAVKDVIKEILDTHKTIDLLVNNAGITRDQLLMKMTEEDWDQVIDVNLKSCFNTSQAVIRAMMKARKGAIINISSVIGIIGNIGQVNYASSKAALFGFTKSLAKEVASRNIRVNCVAPGFIDTRMTMEMGEEQKQQILSSIPLGRMGLPEEVADTVLFLASSKSSYITGQILSVDGGMT